MDLRKSCF